MKSHREEVGDEKKDLNVVVGGRERNEVGWEERETRLKLEVALVERQKREGNKEGGYQKRADNREYQLRTIRLFYFQFTEFVGEPFSKVMACLRG